MGRPVIGAAVAAYKALRKARGSDTPLDAQADALVAQMRQISSVYSTLVGPKVAADLLMVIAKELRDVPVPRINMRFVGLLSPKYMNKKIIKNMERAAKYSEKKARDKIILMLKCKLGSTNAAAKRIHEWRSENGRSVEFEAVRQEVRRAVKIAEATERASE